MRIILLTPYLFPHSNPRAHRWTAIAREWSRQGWEVHVVCSKYPGPVSGAGLDGLRVYRAGFNSAKEFVYRHFPAIPRRGAPGSGPAGNPLTSFLGRLNDWTLKPWYWPDDAWLWIRPAGTKAAHLLENGPWDALVTVSLPFSAHWVGLKLKKQFPKICWLADIGDPFSLQTEHPLNNLRLYRKKNEAAEKAVLKHADLVTVTNDGLAKAYRQMWPELKTPIHVIPPLASLPAVPSTQKPDPSGGLQFGYFGSFFKNIREPAPLLEFFERLCLYNNDFTLHLYGEIFEHFRSVFDRYPSLKTHLNFHGLVSREEAARAMLQMDRLILLGNTTTFQLPSKWADYLLSGKPVVHLVQTPEDPALPLVKDQPNILSLPLYEGNWDNILELFRSWKAPEGDGAIGAQRFSAAAVADAYGDLLK